MDQNGNICRCHCHSAFCGVAPKWSCYCNCNEKSNLRSAYSRFNYKIAEEKPASTIDYLELIEKIETLMKFREAYHDQLKFDLEWKEKIEKQIESMQSQVANHEHKIEHFYEVFNKLIKRMEKLEGYIEMEDRITASDVLIRLSVLEKLATN